MAVVTAVELQNQGLAFGCGAYPRNLLPDYYYIVCDNCQNSECPQWMWASVCWETPVTCQVCNLGFRESFNRTGMKIWTAQLELERRILDLRKLLAKVRAELQDMELRMMTLRTCYRGIEDAIAGLDQLRARIDYP